jgi:hypothetical protein
MRRACLCAVSFSAWLATALLGAAETSKAVRLYTNEDLDRVSPLRDQTGVFSAPAAAPETPPARSGAGGRGREGTRGESYWRREADRVRQRLEPMRQRAEDLRFRMQERERRPGVRLVSDPQLQGWGRRLGELEQRIRDLEGRFEDRARREGALPGWLR